MSGETRRPWSIQEDEAIKVIVKQLGTKRWSDVSQSMQEKFKLFGRTGKQCRQRWHNHLAPQVNKKPWSNQQQQILFQAHKKHGNRWTQISKLIEGRTDNAIKNHFYSSIRRSLRRINKILGSKNSTVKMRNVKPAVLSTIFNMADRDEDTTCQDYKDLTSALIQFSRNRVKKQKSISQQEKIGLESLIQKLMEFNDVYQKQKKVSKSNSIASQFSKNNSEFSSQEKNISNQEELDQQQQDNPVKQQQEVIINPQSNLQSQQLQNHNNMNKKMNLQKSEYDWEQFQQRCQTIVNRYLVSMGSLKSLQNIPLQQINHTSQQTDSQCKQQTTATPIKSQRESLCSSRDVLGQKKKKSR